MYATLYSMKSMCGALRESEKVAAALNESLPRMQGHSLPQRVCIILLFPRGGGMKMNKIEFSPFLYVTVFGGRSFQMVRASLVELQCQLYL